VTVSELADRYERRAIPKPEEQPTMSVPEAGGYCKLGGTASYEAAARGELPVLNFGRTLRVSTAALRRLLGIDADG
jgi:hypothetical protein